MSFAILKFLNAFDVRHLACAVTINRSLLQNVLPPCMEVLKPLREIERRRSCFEKIFSSCPVADNLKTRRSHLHEELMNSTASHAGLSCDIGPEYRVAFLDWNESLQWLPPASEKLIAWCEDGTRADALAPVDANSLREAARRLNLTIPQSFLTFMSDIKLQFRLPHSFWMPDCTSIPEASRLITNGQDGYVLDFCYQYYSVADARMWSLWLGPQGSHCVIQRDVPARVSALQEAQLVGASFETWLACTFFAHWENCSMNSCSDNHWHLDQRLLASLNSYTLYNYDTSRSDSSRLDCMSLTKTGPCFDFMS